MAALSLRDEKRTRPTEAVDQKRLLSGGGGGGVAWRAAPWPRSPFGAGCIQAAGTGRARRVASSSARRISYSPQSPFPSCTAIASTDQNDHRPVLPFQPVPGIEGPVWVVARRHSTLGDHHRAPRRPLRAWDSGGVSSLYSQHAVCARLHPASPSGEPTSTGVYMAHLCEFSAGQRELCL